ncbi:hypothetical protein U732_3613 [Clostridium argentinense CDC 2741]|uniref:Uncharacterized protein n=1 Tax=Clostridium argentinense CDC 2741 TaxID=1418104 RepID=A0A0C1U4W3_9CLOT|nr:hypothetical protein [Clostridium argentinense]ARC86230.1 hypothetical protein RSJ17_17900 [Clostridium argentinense]KIE47799.1 hypothetical protein U732_3613 [Clostridium argentinense CDC 2741]NFF41168.1 hypothetical protein [Clostridium argentinense]NFP51797.1 hypothetical protein [Clostridium argentinense]NFP73882.1 hypothetical protein [Clostridium argentinense]
MELLNASGVAYATLLDFDGNGIEELFICYNSTESKMGKYIEANSPCMYEIWGYNGSSYLIAKEWATVFGGGSSLRGNLEVYESDEKCYVVNNLRGKEADETGVTWHYRYVYGNIINGK